MQSELEVIVPGCLDLLLLLILGLFQRSRPHSAGQKQKDSIFRPLLAKFAVSDFIPIIFTLPDITRLNPKRRRQNSLAQQEDHECNG
jgi:hypothetical protein